MNALNQEINNNLPIWGKLGIECFKEHPTDKPDEPVRAYLCSKKLGGTLAVNHGEGWIPIYPEKPNYPMKFKWYSPRSYSSGAPSWAEKEWQKAVIAALDPEPYLKHMDVVGQKTAKERAEKLRDQFRAQITIALIRGLK